MADDDVVAVRLARIEERLIGIDSAAREIKEHLHSKYVTREEFQPVKNIVYGMVGVLLLSVLAAILKVIFK